MVNSKWDWRFINAAKFFANWSKDPNTKCGAVIVRPDRTICSIGFNGFPRGMSDYSDQYENREIKLKKIIHAEMNAFIHSKDSTFENYTLYVWPFPPCQRCLVHAIQYGITRIVSIRDEEYPWRDDLHLELKQFCKEAGIILDVYENI